MRPIVRPCLVTLLSIVAATAYFAPAPAVAQDGLRQHAELRFAEQEPSTPTAATFDIDYVNPDDPNAKPSSVRRIVSEFAPGTVVDTSVPDQCMASDGQLAASGAAACPTGSQVGAGYVRIDTGFPGPERFLEQDIALFNRDGQLIFLFTNRDTGLRFVSRCPIEGTRITCTSPPLPGTPPDGGAVDLVHEDLFEISRRVNGQRRAYIQTPPACPPSGAWTNLSEFTYADGVTQTVETQSPCVATAGGGKEECRGREATHPGSPGSDAIVGTDGDDVIFAGQGDDRIRSGGGNDRICAGRGRDLLAGGGGDDWLHAGRGDDQLRGGGGSNKLRGNKGDDACDGRGRERSCEA
jgi:RTX calcium-binding nonapeptide repeat (4 copies)